MAHASRRRVDYLASGASVVSGACGRILRVSEGAVCACAAVDSLLRCACKQRHCGWLRWAVSDCVAPKATAPLRGPLRWRETTRVDQRDDAWRRVQTCVICVARRSASSGQQWSIVGKLIVVGGRSSRGMQVRSPYGTASMIDHGFPSRVQQQRAFKIRKRGGRAAWAPQENREALRRGAAQRSASLTVGVES